ncbi:MAG: excinuclease ABC subunit UvrA, partial [Burkholderiales bacterium]
MPDTLSSLPRETIVIRGARQNNLKNLSLEIPLNELVVVTGVSGSGKSSLVFDTLYAEGQRRYVETFSPYARQFLDRQDRPKVDSIEGIPPAIAIDQVNPVRTSRSTVGTMTELNDHLKLLFARAAHLYCKGCGAKVSRDTPQTIFDALQARAQAAGDPRLAIAFPVPVPANFKADEVKSLLAAQGYTRLLHEDIAGFEVVQDRLRMGNADRARVVDALEAALKVGQGRINVHVLAADDANAASGTVWRYSADLHCAECDIHYAEPNPSLFSFNSPMGACDACRGFGRVIGLDFGLVVPDESKSLRDGAVKPWQTPSNRECQDDLMKYARLRGIPVDKPWRELSAKEKRWVLDGEPEWENWRKSWPGTWYGVARFFKWLETKAYKMHVRVLLSKYRAYTGCTACGGARLKTDALLWRIGSSANAGTALGERPRYKPHGVKFGDERLAALPGLTVHDVMLLPLERTRALFDALELPAPLDEATEMLVGEIRTRLDYLNQVGLGYLTLDRQSRTLSGGEVQRINLTTALGTSLVNTLFVLDEPSIGLHPRDMGRVIGVMHKLRDAGNSLVVVEHDPQVMLAADRLLDIGPGPGSKGGEIVAFDTPAQIMRTPGSVTGRYLCGILRTAEPGRPNPPAGKSPQIRLRGAAEHNLRHIDVDFPLRRLVCVTGVSGSGKSTLVQDVLYAALRKALGQPTETPGKHDSLYGADQVGEVVMVDQSSIGRTTRSNPASYVGAFDAVRSRFSSAPLAQSRGYTAGTFSFNSGTGRCPTCSGNGFEHVEMQFLSDVYLRCPDCDGRRYRAEVLEITVDGKSIADVLDMTVADALEFFNHAPDIVRVLRPLVDVGLDYLKLGQPVPTLSGGEAQRLKLAGFLAEAAQGGRNAVGAKGTLFLFDEPTTGLHFDDVRKLLAAFRKLIAAGHSLIVIEHNLDVIRAADWIIDLGPEGGDAGGMIVCTGTPETVAAHDASHTGKALRDYAAAPGAPPAMPKALPATARH